MRIFKVLLAALVAVVAVNLVFIVFRPGGDSVQLLVSDILPALCACLSIIGAGAAFASLSAWDRAKAAWLLILAGVACFAIAESAYLAQDLVLKLDDFPSWADLFWVIGYLPFLAGLLVFLSAYLRGGLSFGKWRPVLLPASALFIASLACIAVFVLAPIAADPQTGFLAKLVYAYYPLGDLALIAPVVVIVYLAMQFGRGKFSLPWKLIGAGLLCFALSDIAYSVLSWQGSYEGGGITDLGWNLAYLLVALGGAAQARLVASLGRGGAS